MKIAIEKTTSYHSKYEITREDNSVDRITLETNTYLIHDICHFAVEKHLEYSKGFWGMLAAGYSFGELSGKTNPNTEELRFIEQIVGPIQSIYLRKADKNEFEFLVSHLNYKISGNILESIFIEIQSILEKWELLKLGEQLVLDWKLT